MSTLDAAIRAKLDETRAYMNGYYDLPNAGEMLAAIEAVLGKHEPVSNEAWASSAPAIVCSCSPGEDDHYDEPYPCPTVRAIAEKLGVEVERG